MFNLVKRNELTKKVNVKDVKYYLEKEYDRASERENTIKELENQIVRLKEIEIKYDAMLVVQEKREERYQKQEDYIKELREKITILQNNIKNEISKQNDIRINAEKKLKEKDTIIKEKNDIIKDKNKEIKELKKNK